MKILIYTRLENNTGGDEQLFKMVTEPLLSYIPPGSEVRVCIACDQASIDRAQRLEGYLENLAQLEPNPDADADVEIPVKFNLDYHIVNSKTPHINANLGKIDKNFKQWNVGSKNKGIPRLDTFVIAGWAHLQHVKRTLDFMEKLISLPKTTKILLCSPPGAYIDQRGLKSGLMERGYENVYCFQPGLYEPAGFPLPPNQLSPESLENLELREQWLAHINPDGNLDGYLPAPDEGIPDKLIVIYCSKDGPGEAGANFINRIRDQKGDDAANYKTLLIGAEPGTVAFEQWESLLAGEDQPIQIPFEVLPRTGSSEILMKGLKDAEFSMATGSFSILEARALGIDHCEYLAPIHLTQFGESLATASPEDVRQAVERGSAALEEISRIHTDDFMPEILHHSNGVSEPTPALENPGISLSSSN